MTPEERELLLKSIEISEENNKILRAMRRSARIASALRILYWLIIIGAAFGAYYTIQPLMDKIIENFYGMKEGVESVKTISSSLPDWVIKK